MYKKSNKISVALATYNGEKYIIEQLDSILNQTTPVDEVIISDDCSTDDTVRVISDYIKTHQLKNWMIFVNENNLGFSFNFFNAITKTTGDIVFLADQDDVWLDNKVSEMMGYFLSNLSTQVVASGMKFIDRNGKIDKTQNEILFQNIFKTEEFLPYHFFIGSSVIPGCTYAFRSSIRDVLVNSNLPNLNRSLGHDWLIAATGAAIGKFKKISNVLIKRRIHESNASKGNLRKTTVLSANLEKRLDGFKQIVNAHKFLLENQEIANRLNKNDINSTKKMIQFFESRIKFTQTKNFFIWIYLGLRFKMYLQCAKIPKVALQLYVADLLYTYNINWKVK